MIGGVAGIMGLRSFGAARGEVRFCLRVPLTPETAMISSRDVADAVAAGIWGEDLGHEDRTALGLPSSIHPS